MNFCLIYISFIAVKCFCLLVSFFYFIVMYCKVLSVDYRVYLIESILVVKEGDRVRLEMHRKKCATKLRLSI